MSALLFQTEHVIKAFDVAVYSSHYSLYGDMSSRALKALQEFRPVDQLSRRLFGDEAFERGASWRKQ